MTEELIITFGALYAATLLIPSSIFLAYWLNHRSMPFWRTAAIGGFLLFVGSVILLKRDALPTIAVSILTNTLFGVGYHMSLRAVRMSKNCWKFHQIDQFATVSYFIGLVLVSSTMNTGLTPIALVSCYVIAVSVAAILAFRKCEAPISRVGDAALQIYLIGSCMLSIPRLVATMSDARDGIYSFGFWNMVFYIWILIAVFCYVIGLFLNGNVLIANEARRSLNKERHLATALAETLEGQRNLLRFVLHEIKRPLGTISAVATNSANEKMGMSVEEVDRVRRLSGLAGDYLREISEYEDIHTLFDSPMLIEIGVDDLIEDIRNKWQISIDASREAELIKISADPLLFDIAIGNLIENAIKFGTSESRTQLNVHSDGNSVFFDVVDDGRGIRPDEAENVFQMFYTIKGNQTNDFRGGGLGLYVVRRIAEAHSGECRVVSEYPSTLRLSFPVMLTRGAHD